MFYDEPHMQDMISLLDEPSRVFLADAADRERERLPLFPAHFKRLWESEDGKGGSFGNGELIIRSFFSVGNASCFFLVRFSGEV